ncbi:MAG: asparagine synthase [Microbacterium sp.]
MGKTADAIAEGIAIAAAAARLAVSNRIIVATIGEGAAFDVERFAPFARDTLLHLAEEQERAADLMQKEIKNARGLRADAAGTHDYKGRDVRNLKRRERQYRGVAELLRSFADDPLSIEALIDQSRDAAWHDVEKHLMRRLSAEASHPEHAADYAAMRDARIQALQRVDLERLEAHQRRLGQLPAAEG